MLENAAAITLLAFAALLVGYFTYGRFLARRICRLDPNRVTPSHEFEDGVDYVPTRKPILFGHHFASIAGLGPILGPAIAVTWGWLPAVAWVLVGSIFIGAVHDLGALTLSLRHQGRSVGDICRDVMGPRARLLALVIIFFLMSLAMGAFCSVLSDLFVNYNPDAIIPSVGLMIVAVGFGIAVYRFRAPLAPATIVSLMLFAGLIVWGVERPVCSYEWFCSEPTRSALAAGKEATAVAPEEVDDNTTEIAENSPILHLPYGATEAIRYLHAVGNVKAAEEVARAVPETQRAWIFTLLGYGFLASVLPVWLLLQPRDYINSFQLYFALGAMLIGLTIAAATGAAANHIEAPAVRLDVPGAPPIFPFLFVIVACGAVSGFHSLVSSGTTVKQLNRESDALPIGYGAMLVEGALAVLVVMACVAGLGAKAWAADGVYASWQGVGGGGLGAQLSAVVRGGASFLYQIGVPVKYGRTFIAVTVSAFALTTLDSATRLLRFNVEETMRSVRLQRFANRYMASAVAVGGIAFFALSPSGKPLWILFGTTNQLLAGLTLLTVSVFLFQRGRRIIYTLAPMILMLGVSIYALLLGLWGFLVDAKWTAQERWTLSVVSVVVLAISVWLLVEGILAFTRGRRGGDEDDAGRGDGAAAKELIAAQSTEAAPADAAAMRS